MADHLAWDGSHLWGVVHSMPNHTGAPDGRLIKIDLEQKKVVKTIEVPFRDAATMTPMGLAWDGKYLWTNDAENRAFYRIDPETGEGKDQPYISSLSVKGHPVSPCGISWDGHRCLWISVLSLDAYVQVDPKSKQVVSFLLPPDNPDPTKYGKFRPDHVKQLFTGMTTDGRRVWVVDEIEGNPLVYELDVDFPTTGPCAHPVEVGEACVPDGEPYCFSEATCFGATDKTTCHQTCDRSAPDCPDGSTCWTKPEVGDVCIPGDSSGAFADACTADTDCQSALCVQPEDGSVAFCSESCQAGDDSACPEGYSCGTAIGDNACLVTVEKTEETEETDSGGEGGCAMAARQIGGPISLAVLLFVLVGIVLRSCRWR
jgi:hypothetical protein